MISKGGKKDRRRGFRTGSGTATQIAFLDFLCRLKKDHIELLIQNAPQIRLTEFEVESLRNLHWFQSLCRRWGSPENYPDAFHLWTAERNGLDVVLTLDRGFFNFLFTVRKHKSIGIDVRTEVLRPLDLLRKLGIDKPDLIPMDSSRFYHLFERPNELTPRPTNN